MLTCFQVFRWGRPAARNSGNHSCTSGCQWSTQVLPSGTQLLGLVGRIGRNRSSATQRVAESGGGLAGQVAGLFQDPCQGCGGEAPQRRRGWRETGARPERRWRRWHSQERPQGESLIWIGDWRLGIGIYSTPFHLSEKIWIFENALFLGKSGRQRRTYGYVWNATRCFAGGERHLRGSHQLLLWNRAREEAGQDAPSADQAPEARVPRGGGSGWGAKHRARTAAALFLASMLGPPRRIPHGGGATTAQ